VTSLQSSIESSTRIAVAKLRSWANSAWRQWEQIMVARFTNDASEQGWFSPLPEPTDSADVHIAIRAARSFETRGQFAEAARWLRRAATLIEREGDDGRALVLARAAADLTSAADSGSRAASAAPPAPPSDVPERKSIQPPKPRQPAWLSTLTLLPDTAAAGPAPLTPKPPTMPASAKPPATPTPAKPPATPTPAKPSSMPASAKPPMTASTRPPRPTPVTSPPPVLSAVASNAPSPAGGRFSSAPPRPAEKSAPPEAPSTAASSELPEQLAERTAIRVAFRPSERHANLIVVRRLQSGESLPNGSSEALLVLSPESSGALQERKP
jgi:hypothetical protein